MEVSVVRPQELGAGEVARWREFQRAQPELGNPFLAPDFSLAVGRVRDTARVAVLEEGGEIVGFFPYEQRGWGLGRAIGTGVSDCQGLVHAPGLRWDPLALLRECGLVVWEFDHLVSGQEPFAPYHTRQARSPVLDLSDGYDAYLEDRRRATKETVTTMLRKQRKLAREVGDIRFAFDVADAAALQTLRRWKSALYQRTLQPDRFADQPIVRLVEDLLHTKSPECRGTLSVLYAGEQLLAAHFGIRSQGVLSYWFPAYDVEFGTYSPGLLLCFLLAREAAAHGIVTLDLGKGDMRYKDSLANRYLDVAEGAVERRSAVAAARRLQRSQRSHLVHFARSHPRLKQHAQRLLRVSDRWRG